MLAFWDGEEFGLVGSTEYMEKHADELSQKLVAYINSDSNGKGRLGVGGSHSLESFSQEVARDIKDPVSGKTLLEEILTRPRRGRGGAAATPDGETPTPPGEFRISPLGSGSDYTPFLQHLGIASLNVGFGGEGGGGVYHSDYDDFYWYSHFSDTNFIYGKTLAQVDVTLGMRLADAPILPFEFGHLSATIGRYLDEIEKLPNQKRKVDLSKVRAEVTQLSKAAAAFDSVYGREQSKLSAAGEQKLAAIDQILFQSERDLTLDPGLPGRPWFRHRIYAPGKYTGYAVKTLPGIREAVEAGNPEEAEQQAQQVAQVLHTLNEQIGQASKLLGSL
jgi:N-acetylated-alpha-linked acidic dipeptidase